MKQYHFISRTDIIIISERHSSRYQIWKGEILVWYFKYPEMGCRFIYSLLNNIVDNSGLFLSNGRMMSEINWK
jgi:hypothetical protein